MRRPSATRKALSFCPLVKASWADTARVKRVPFMAARASPFVLFAWRPAAERAADTRGLLLSRVSDAPQQQVISFVVCTTGDDGFSIWTEGQRNYPLASQLSHKLSATHIP